MVTFHCMSFSCNMRQGLQTPSFTRFVFISPSNSSFNTVNFSSQRASSFFFIPQRASFDRQAFAQRQAERIVRNFLFTTLLNNYLFTSEFTRASSRCNQPRTQRAHFNSHAEMPKAQNAPFNPQPPQMPKAQRSKPRPAPAPQMPKTTPAPSVRATETSTLKARALKMLNISNTASNYDILGVSSNASKNEIKKAYFTLCRTFHPDKYKGNDAKAAEEAFKLIDAAYKAVC